MTRLLLGGIAPFAVFAGTALALLFRFLPPPTGRYWAVPPVLVILGCLGIARLWSRRAALVTLLGCLLLVALGALVIRPRAGNEHTSTARSPGSLSAVALEIPPGLAARIPGGKHRLEAPAGFSVSVFAAGLDGPRMLAFSQAGDLFVSLPRAGQVVVLPDRDGDGTADRIQVFAEDLDRPHGLTFHGADLVVAENGRLLRLEDGDGDLAADRVTVLSTDLPGGGGHWTRSLADAPDGGFFVSAGSSCNACRERDARRAAVLKIPTGGGPAEIFARGLRNSVGLAVHPETGDLWGSDNGRDWLGDDLPPEEINRIAADGDYGWPYCYGQRVPDPEFGTAARCRKTIPPAVEMQAHSAPLGIAFGFGLAFPAHYRNMLYVAFHGSWNRSVPTGYKLVGIPFAGGRPAGPVENVITGWLQGSSAWGRPVDPVVGPDGALYLSDDRAGIVYRVTAGTRH